MVKTYSSLHWGLLKIQMSNTIFENPCSNKHAIELKKILEIGGHSFFSFPLMPKNQDALLKAIALRYDNLSTPSIVKKFVVLNENHPQLVWENLPLCSDKQAIRTINQTIFAEIKVSGAPLIQKWYWPNGCRSFFSFRADMDAGNEASLSRFIEAIRPWSASLSLFVCGKAYLGKEPLLQRVAELGAEIGNHTFTHYVFADKNRNRKNLELTESLLFELGITPKGYVGPASFWHPSMYEVLVEKGYQYSSSFGVDHDNYPYFFPKNESEVYDLVEIPFHCLGDRFPKFGLELDSEEVGTFFDHLLEKKYHRCEPMFIYGHPDMPGRMGDCPELVERICRKALSYADVCTGNMADIAAWWRRRDRATADIAFDKVNNRVIATNYQASPDVYWSIQLTADCKYLVSGRDLQEGVHLDSLDRFKKIDLVNIPHGEVGEVVAAPLEKKNLRKTIGKWRRDFQRKRRMVRELNLADLHLKRTTR